MKFLLRHLELVFTVAGLVVIFGVTAVFTPTDASHWSVAAITATLVGIIHGALFWLVRRRQREVRRIAIADIQRMLQDQIRHQLAVVDAMSQLREARPDEARRARDFISRSVANINAALELLSEESLRSWHAKATAHKTDRSATADR